MVVKRQVVLLFVILHAGPSSGDFSAVVCTVFRKSFILQSTDIHIATGTWKRARSTLYLGPFRRPGVRKSWMECHVTRVLGSVAIYLGVHR